MTRPLPRRPGIDDADADLPVVLVVEDDRGLRESLAMVLEFQDVDVVQADTGEAGLRLVDELDPAAVVLDVNLPGIDGFEVCRRLRQRGAKSFVQTFCGTRTTSANVESTENVSKL